MGFGDRTIVQAWARFANPRIFPRERGGCWTLSFIVWVPFSSRVLIKDMRIAGLMTSKDTNDSSDYHGSLRNHLERENLRKDFEIMWQASLGRRKEILLVMVAIGLALFFGGLNPGFQTTEYSLMYGGLLLAAWGCIGLTPGIVIQDCIASQPFLVVEFMRQKPEVGVKTFSRELLIYLHIMSTRR